MLAVTDFNSKIHIFVSVFAAKPNPNLKFNQLFSGPKSTYFTNLIEISLITFIYAVHKQTNIGEITIPPKVVEITILLHFCYRPDHFLSTLLVCCLPS